MPVIPENRAITQALTEIQKALQPTYPKYYYFFQPNGRPIQVEEKDLDSFLNEFKGKKIEKAFIGQVGKSIKIIREKDLPSFVKEYPDANVMEFLEHPVTKKREVGILRKALEATGLRKPVHVSPEKVTLKETGKEALEALAYGTGAAFLPPIGAEALSGLAGLISLAATQKPEEAATTIEKAREKIYGGLEKIPVVGTPVSTIGEYTQKVFHATSVGISKFIEETLKQKGVETSVAETIGDISGRAVWDALLIGGGLRSIRVMRDRVKVAKEAAKQAMKDVEYYDPEYLEKLAKVAKEKRIYKRMFELGERGYPVVAKEPEVPASTVRQRKYPAPELVRERRYPVPTPTVTKRKYPVPVTESEIPPTNPITSRIVEYMSNPELLNATKKWREEFTEQQRKAERIRYLNEQLKEIDRLMSEKGIDVDVIKLEKDISVIEREIASLSKKKTKEARQRVKELKKKKERLEKIIEYKLSRPEKVIPEVPEGPPVLLETMEAIRKARNPLEMALELYRKHKVPWEKVVEVYPEVREVDQAIIRKLDPKEVANKMVEEGKNLIEVVSWYRTRPKPPQETPVPERPPTAGEPPVPPETPPVVEEPRATITQPKKEKVTYSHLDPETGDIYVLRYGKEKKYDPQTMEIVDGKERMERDIKYVEYKKQFVKKYREEYPGLTDDEIESVSSMVALDALNFGEKHDTIQDSRLALVVMLKRKGLRDKEIPEVISGLKEGKPLKELIKTAVKESAPKVESTPKVEKKPPQKIKIEPLPKEAYESPERLQTEIENRLGRHLSEDEVGFLNTLVNYRSVTTAGNFGNDFLSFVKDNTVLYDRLSSKQKAEFLRLLQDYLKIPDVQKIPKVTPPRTSSDIIKTVANVKSKETGKPTNYVYVDEDYVIATDGYVLIRVKNSKKMESGLYDVTDLGTIKKVTDDVTYPNYKNVFPPEEQLSDPYVLTKDEFLYFTEVVSQIKKQNKIPSGVPVYVEIDGKVFNVDLMKKILKTVGDFAPDKVFIRLHKKYGPTLIESKDVSALIMPVKYDRNIAEANDIISLNEIIKKPEKVEVETAPAPVTISPETTFKEFAENIKGKKLSELTPEQREQFIREFNETKLGAKEYEKERIETEKELERRQKEVKDEDDIVDIEKKVQKIIKKKRERGSISFEPVKRLDEQLKAEGIIVETEPEVYKFMRHIKPKAREYDFWTNPVYEVPRYLKDWLRYARFKWTSLETIMRTFPDKSEPAEIMISRDAMTKSLMLKMYESYFAKRMRLSEVSRKKVDELIATLRVKEKKGRLTNEELANLGLNEQEIALYNQWMDTSREAIEIIRDALIENHKIPDPDYSIPRSAFEAKELIKRMREEGADPVSLTRARQILKIHKMCDELIDSHYIPFDRYGRYFLLVKEKGKEKPLYFTHDDSLVKLKHMAIELRKKHPDAEITIGENYKAAIMGHESLPPSMLVTMKMILNELRKDGALPKPLLDLDVELTKITAKWGARFPVHLLRAQKIPGWSTDYDRAIANYIVSLSRWASNVKHASKFREALAKLDPVKDAPLIEFYKSLNDYSTMNRKHYSGLSRLMFIQYLAGNVKSMVVNQTQSITVTLPYSTKYLGNVEALRVYKEACKIATEYMMGKRSHINPELRAILDEMKAKGELSAQAVEAYMGAISGKGQIQMKGNQAIELLSLGWKKVEEFNRTHAAVTAWRIAKKKNIRSDHISEFVRRFIADTQFEYGQIYRPLAVQHPVIAPLFIFRTYAYHWLRVMKNLLKEGDYSTFVKMFVPILVLGGISGVPFARDLLNVIAKLTGYDATTEMKEKIDPTAFDMIMYGVPALLGVSIGASINPLELPRTERGGIIETTARAVGGVITDLPMRVERAYRMYQEYGDVYRAVENLMPEFIRNVLVAYRWVKEEGARTPSGEKFFTTSPVDIVLRSLGFQPTKYLKGIEKIERIREMEREAKTETKKINVKLAKAIYDVMTGKSNGEEVLNIIENIMVKNIKYIENGELEKVIIPDERTLKLNILKMACPDVYEILKAPQKARPEVLKLIQVWSTALNITPEELLMGEELE